MKFISFVIDINYLHYYQAQLLLHSLILNTNFSKENIIVQCIEGVHQEFIDYLEKEGFKYHYISPFLDKKYCNKLQQLEYFISNDLDVQSVILMDADMYAIDNAIYELDSDKIMGKIVDAPNPPLEIISNIFHQASLELPDIVSTDWNRDNNNTVKGNFNGGFYYIPAKYIKTLDSYWKKWATWLFENKKLFVNPAYAIHTDQLSFAMALQDSDIPYESLETNYNFPIHSKSSSNYFNRFQSVHLIHYHRQIDDFGFIDTSKIAVDEVKKVVEEINLQISNLEIIDFYFLYKKSLVSFNSELSKSFKDKFSKLFERYSDIQLYLHAGTPKTATTTFQFTCSENVSYLRQQHIFYPSVYKNRVPKHQWLVQLMRSKNLEELYNIFADILESAYLSQCKTIVLSTEGLYNHWWDFPDTSKEVLKIISKYLDTKLLIVFREPTSFLYSFYQQNLKNPQMDLVKCYGRDWTFEQMLNDPWFIKHLDYLSFINDIEGIFGVENISILTYDKKVLDRLFSTIGLDIEHLKVKTNHNIGLNPIAIELLKTLNRFNLDLEDKQIFIKYMSDMNDIFKKYDIPKSTLGYKKIKHLFSLQEKVLLKYKNIQFTN